MPRSAKSKYSPVQDSSIGFGLEMKSTGEVTGIDYELGMAFAKSQMAASGTLPTGGNVFISVKETDRSNIVCATSGIGSIIGKADIAVNILHTLTSGQRPNVIDLMKNKDMALAINAPSGKSPTKTK